MATAIHHITRPLHAIVCDMLATRERRDELYRKADLDDVEEAACAAMDDRLTALERECDAALYAVTGVSWQVLEGARA